MRYVSLFSGIEAATVAWEPLGWEPVAFAEIEPFPCAVLEHHWPHVPNLGDVCAVDWKEFVKDNGAVDVIVGGSPCQSFSIAGGREGLDGESRLMYEYIRAVQDLRPRWFLWENVPGVFSTDAGRAFGILLDELEECGYVLAWRVLDAQFFGVAQRRRRVFLVGYLGDTVGIPAAVLFNAESVSGNTQSSKQKREELTRATKERTRTSSQVMPFDSTQITSKANQSKPDFGRECHTLSAEGHAPTIISLLSDGTTSQNSNGLGYCEDGSAYTLNTVDHQSVLCVSDDQANASIDENLCGTLKVGGFTVASNGKDYIGALCARDYKGIGNQDVGEGKVICQHKC